MPMSTPSVRAIVGRIRPPVFPRRTLDVDRYGAVADGMTNCGPILGEAISECHASGGGRVLVPAGRYLVRGPIRLLSNVDLHLAEGAFLRFGVNPADYLPPVVVRWEGTLCYNYSPLVYARGQENIAVTGRGVLDGQAGRFWGAWKSRQSRDQHTLREMGRRATPLAQRVFGAGHFLRPSLFEPHRCRNVLVEGVTLKGSPFWTLHPVFCSNVTVRNVHVLAGTTNDDACDPDSCHDVLIEDCRFASADDSVAIKAGRDRDGRSRAGCANVVVRRCTSVRSRASAFSVGSEMSGGVRNVYFEDCAVGRVREFALYVKSNSDRGGFVENVRARGVRVEACQSLVSLQTDYKRVRRHPHPARYSDLRFEELSCRRTEGAGIYSVGTATEPIERVVLRSITVQRAGVPPVIRHTAPLEVDRVRVNGRRWCPPEPGESGSPRADRRK